MWAIMSTARLPSRDSTQNVKGRSEGWASGVGWGVLVFALVNECGSKSGYLG